ncbi:tetratricopeptide repeat protein [Streptomyces acidicola]|uniref:Tetratricopeptide repeat protein n=1 Tax=Streptomyces acidicola TaxID=2596892 RepID=A0A5N8X7Z5_9ACTN|nr:tetratricopeptide repeat protein [Streptomyces acidicola]MPY55600.1 tetratricopeptide repeat protein [Streptomyces acidicola]
MSSHPDIDPETQLRAVEILRTPPDTVADAEEADRALRPLEKVLPATQEGPLRATILSNLGLLRLARFRHSSDPADLDQAIAHLAEASTGLLTHGSPPALSATIPNLISALHTRAEVTGNTDDLDAAIAWGRSSVVHLPARLTQRAAALASLSSALRVRYERSRYAQAEHEGDLTEAYAGDLTEAIELGHQAIADLPDDHPRLGSTLSNLGSAYLLAGRAEEAISLFERAVAQARAVRDTLGLARTLNNLAGSFLRAGRPAEATHTYEEALEAFRAIGDREGAERVANNLTVVRDLLAPPDTASPPETDGPPETAGPPETSDGTQASAARP